MHVVNPSLKIADVRMAIRHRLRDVAGDAAAFEANCLLGDVIGAGPVALTLRYHEELSEAEAERVESLVCDRLRGRPLAYVLGHVQFHDLDLLCDERALIPRCETEEIVEIALRMLPPAQVDQRPVVVDVGTGSGNIALALANSRSDLRVIATEIEPDALELARENGQRNGLSGRVEWLMGSLLEPITNDKSVDLIVSNPPYVALGDPAVECAVVEHEPHVAVFAGPHGLEVISELLDQAPRVLRAGGSFVSEIGYDQSAAVRNLVTCYDHWSLPDFHRDLAGIERILALRYTP